ncbi:hypothetical protein GLOTRDRAFT_134340 [Gloeophyllum trabeum ATCC 11539]|uniref:Uncharacterized protein n=1 Tax=Gloeophyllum trabeum (strain ATCC 11539 / FP-39264 / Madison 617) TaxID=670483 RepID=S7R6M1_GLOTA|nr:uncharacterized protein GLOTRDRAFT_134340 [Gloeophyllum trabeum ATCC 11539]EPQ50015.1 hypothetical protein GLOTRDRAFT_134340 [Gloeophyllum trabeum ATCC 11539]
MCPDALWQGLSDGSSSNPNDSEDNEEQAAKGRMPDGKKTIIYDGLREIEDMYAAVARRAGVTTQQVLAIHKATQTSVNAGKGIWQIYEAYFSEHAKEECQRLRDLGSNPEEEVAVSHDRDTVARCWEKFKSANPTTHVKYLQKWYELVVLTNPDMSLGMRKRTFKTFTQKLVQMVESYQRLHGFQVALVASGINVNQDEGLGLFHETKYASGLFAKRCRMEGDELIGYLKSHTYHLRMKEGVDLAWADEAGTDAQADATSAPAPAALTSSGAADVIDVSKMPAIHEMGDTAMLNHIKAVIRHRIQEAGHTLQGVTFPWKGMPAILAQNGIVCENWPEGVRYPGEQADKGINCLFLEERRTLLRALYHEQSKLVFHPKNDDIASRWCSGETVVVIIGVPPAPKSNHKAGLRVMVKNGIVTYDHRGRQHPVEDSAQTEDRSRNKARRDVQTIEVSSGDSDGSGKLRSHPRRKKRVFIEDAMDIEDEDEEEVRTSETSEVELVPPAAKRHCPPAPRVAQASRKPVSKGKGRAVDIPHTIRRAAGKSKKLSATAGAGMLTAVPEGIQESGHENSELEMVPIVTPSGERMVPLSKHKAQDSSSTGTRSRVGALVPVVELPARTKGIPASSATVKPTPKPRAAYSSHQDKAGGIVQSPFDAIPATRNPFAVSSHASSSIQAMAAPMAEHLRNDSGLTLGSGTVGSGGAAHSAGGPSRLYSGLAGAPAAPGAPNMVQIPAELLRIFVSSMTAASGLAPDPSHQVGLQGMHTPASIGDLAYDSDIQQFRGSAGLGGLDHSGAGTNSHADELFDNPSYLPRHQDDA